MPPSPIYTCLIDKAKYQQSEHPFGTRLSAYWQTGQILLGHTLSQFTEYTRFTGHNETPSVRLHFGLRGDYAFTYQQLGERFDLLGGHHNLMYSQPFDIEVENKTLEIETFGIQFPKESFILLSEAGSEYLKRFGESVALDKAVLLSPFWGGISPEIQQTITEILHHPYEPVLEEKFLYAQSLELLQLSVDNCLSTSQQPFVQTKGDKEKLVAARDFINANAYRAPGLPEIAKAVGLNEYKLKRGFKEMFQSTLWNYLTSQRLVQAYHSLKDSSFSVADIATQFGYATPQHFNYAFRKKFGLTPGALKKSVKRNFRDGQ